MTDTTRDEGGEEGYTRHELLELSASEAHAAHQRGELDEETLETWAALNDLQDELTELKQDVNEAEREIIQGSIQADGEDLTDTGEWFGVTIRYRLRIDGWLKSTLETLGDVNMDDMDAETAEHVRHTVAELLAAMWTEVETSEGMQDLTNVPDEELKEWILRNWVQHPEIGLRGSYLCLVEQIQHATRREREMRERAQKFRKGPGTRDGGTNETHELYDTIGTLSGDE